jgi:hypothetical protein
MDSNKESGSSLPMLVKDLVLVDSYKENICDYSLQEYLEQVLHMKNHLQLECKRSENALNILKDEILRAKQKPVRWAAKELWFQIREPFILIVALLFISLFIWVRLKN